MVAASSPSSLGSSLYFLSRKLPSNKTTSSVPTPACVRFRSPCITATYTSTERTRSPHVCSSNMASMASIYEVLGIQMGATSQEIKAAYRRLVRVCHPNVVAADWKDSRPMSSRRSMLPIPCSLILISTPQREPSQPAMAL